MLMADIVGEVPKSDESLRSLVSRHLLENNKDGYVVDQKNPLYNVLVSVDSGTDLSREGKVTPTIIGMPARNVPGGIVGQENVKKSGLKPDDFIVVYSLNIRNIDGGNRTGPLRGILVLSAEKVNKFTAEIWKDPEKFFKLLRELNDKPLVEKAIRATPAEVLGNKLKLMANTKFGGSMQQNYEVGFRPGYSPSQTVLK